MALLESDGAPVHLSELRRLIRPDRRANWVAATIVTGFAADEEIGWDREKVRRRGMCGWRFRQAQRIN
jgi:hypothetical protein